MSSTALLVSLKQIFLKPGDKLIALALTATSGFCRLTCSADRIETNKAVLDARGWPIEIRQENNGKVKLCSRTSFLSSHIHTL